MAKAKLLDKLPKLPPDHHYEAVFGADLEGDIVMYVNHIDDEGDFVRCLNIKEMGRVILAVNKMLGL